MTFVWLRQMNSESVQTRAIARYKRLLGRGSLIAMGLLASLGSLEAEAEAHHPPYVRVGDGWLKGTREGDGLDRYLGVPYAQAPVGELRWRPPESVEPWKGVKSAENLPPRCAQIGSEGPGNEDCLYMNIFVPRVPRHRGPLPVLFYIHGGSLRVGSAWDNDPSRIARETGTIVVMVNYRLGMLGFMSHAALDAEASDGVSGNYGLMDQQAALQWVHDEISSFGGDPNNVTIAGASAGAGSVCAHLSSEPVQGLFSGAVIQSGVCWAQDIDASLATGTAFAEAAGCADPATAAECLRAQSTEALLAVDSWDFLVMPTWGGALIPAPPAEQIADGNFANVPVVFGFTENETRTSAAGLYPMTLEDHDAFIAGFFGEDADAVKAVYPVENYDDPYYALVDAVDDSGVFDVTGCRAYDLAAQFAAHVPTYVYQFADQSAPNPTWLVAAPGFVAGASHGADEPYWFDRPFDTLPPLTDPQADLASEMVQYLGGFAEDGRTAARHLPRWPRYDSRQRVMQFIPGETGITRSLSDVNHCDFWESLGY